MKIQLPEVVIAGLYKDALVITQTNPEEGIAAIYKQKNKAGRISGSAHQKNFFG